MTSWQPLSVRQGQRPASALADGIPEYLHAPLQYWLEGVCGYRSAQGMQEQLMLQIALRAQIRLQRAISNPVGTMHNLIGAALQDPEGGLNVLDAVLSLTLGHAVALKQILTDGGSAWTVANDGKSLERRVDTATAKSYAAATAPADAASSELGEAWRQAYGRQPNPSDAWDHSIKAVETVLVPIVTPNNPKATLGNVLGEVKASPSKLKFVLQTSPGQTITNVQTVEAMLRLMWPNPDRHGGASGTGRTPTLSEAQAVLQIAITIVNWVRAGVLA
jgi:hypothetical protein